MDKKTVTPKKTKTQTTEQKPPEEYTDRKELKNAIRAAMSDDSGNRAKWISARIQELKNNDASGILAGYKLTSDFRYGDQPTDDKSTEAERLIANAIKSVPLRKSARTTALKARDNELKEEQKDNAPQIKAAQQRAERDAETIERQADADELAKLAIEANNWKALEEHQRRFKEKRATDKKYVDENWARQQAEFDAAKAKTEIETRDKKPPPFEETWLAEKETCYVKDFAQFFDKAENSITTRCGNLWPEHKGQWRLNKSDAKRLYEDIENFGQTISKHQRAQK